MAPKPCPEGDQGWLLPRQPYTPGRTARPGDDDDVHRIAREAPYPTDPARWRTNQAWLAGLRLYRNSFFWEAHEVWEAVWANTRPNSAERALVQGVIQLANAALKQRMNRPGAARRLADLAAGHFETVATSREVRVMGVDILRLREAVGQYRAALECDVDASPPELPFDE